MQSPEIDLYGIVHVKVDFIVVLKLYVDMLNSDIWKHLNNIICKM